MPQVIKQTPQTSINEGIDASNGKKIPSKLELNDNVETDKPPPALTKDKYQHCDLSSFFLDYLLCNLNVNLDTLIELQANARQFFTTFIQEQVDIGWRTCSDLRFVGLMGVNLMVELPYEIENLKDGNLEIYEQVSEKLQKLNMWFNMKFNVEEQTEDKLVITAYLFDKVHSIISKTTLDVLIPRNVDDIVPLFCIADKMVTSALMTFTKMMSVTSLQLHKHKALPDPTVRDFKHPDIDQKEGTEQDLGGDDFGKDSEGLGVEKPKVDDNVEDED